MKNSTSKVGNVALKGLGVALLAAGVQSASAGIVSTERPVDGPWAELTVDGEVWPIAFSATDKGYALEWGIETPEFEVMVEGMMDPDPSIGYGIAVSDFGAPSTFGFSFFTPIVPTGPATTVDASVAGALTDLTGDGVSITPTGATLQTSSVFAPMTSMGVDVGAAAAFPAGAPGALHTYGPFVDGPKSGPVAAGAWTGLGVSTSFSLSGGGDIAALTGFAQVLTAPAVPDAGASAALLGLTFLGLGAARRRSTAA